MSQINYNNWTQYLDKLPEFVEKLSQKNKSQFLFLLQDTKFREYIIKELARFKWGQILKQMTTESIDYLFDNEFLLMFYKDCPEKEKKLAYIVGYLPVEVKQKLVHKPYFYDLLKDIHFAENFMKWARINIDYQTRFKMLHYCLVKNQYSEDVLAIMQSALYTEPYTLELEKDYSANNLAIKNINQLLMDENIFKIYSKSFALLSSLAPENLAFIYSQRNFSDFDEMDINILFKLIENGYEFALPDSVCLNSKFINIATSIQPIERFRKFILHLGVKNKESMKYIQESRNSEYDKIIRAFLYNKIDFDKFNINYLKQIVFDRYFAASPHDTFLMASVIYDAINTMPDYRSRVTQRGFKVVQALVEEFRIELNNLRTNDVDNLSTLNNISSDREIDALKNLCSLLQELSTYKDKMNMAESFAILFKKSREYFNHQIKDMLYTPKDRPTKILSNGVKVYDISEIDFHCLVHVERMEDSRKRLFEPIPEGRHDIDVSMSLLDRNKLDTFTGDVILGYSKISNEAVRHALHKDSYTKNSDKYNTEKYSFAHAVTEYMPTYIDIDSFMALTRGYNEIKIKVSPNAVNRDGQKIFKADYVLCKSEIRAIDMEIALIYDLPIVFIDEKKINAALEREEKSETIKKTYNPFIYKTYPDLKISAISFEDERLLL